MKTLHIFNPEHDLALAVGQKSYTLPAEVVKIKRNKTLLPALFADKGDFILVPQDMKPSEYSGLEYFHLILEKELRIIRPELIKDNISEIKIIKPWGWDHFLRKYLLKFDIGEELLPSEEEVEKIRELSHRRITIPFRQTIAALRGEVARNLPRELFSIEEVEEFLLQNPKAFFKAPWSSSGRGIVVSDHITHKGLFEWIHGILRRQGSVMAEPAWDKTFDFATEWEIERGIPFFKGYSVFEASSRGKYHHNIYDSQVNLLNLIKKNIPDFSEEIVLLQKEALKIHIAPFYSGPLGIDMLADSQGDVNPCVEINLRNTMGNLLLEFQKKD